MGRTEKREFCQCINNCGVASFIWASLWFPLVSLSYSDFKIKLSDANVGFCFVLFGCLFFCCSVVCVCVSVCVCVGGGVLCFQVFVFVVIFDVSLFCLFKSAINGK